VLSAIVPTLVVAALGFVVGGIPAAVAHGFNSAEGRRLVALLGIAALCYAASLVLDPVGGALGTAARQRVTGRLQARLLRAVSAPAGISHLEDQETLDRLARAEGSLTGFFPGDAPVTWAGLLGSRLSGIIACGVIAAYIWWLGPLLLVIWLLVRRVMLGAVVRQATDLRGQTVAMRRAWYFTGVGTKARSAKEVRVFGLARFVADMYREYFTAAVKAGHAGLRGLHQRAAACLLLVLAGYATALVVIADAARLHEIGLRSVAILLPMLAVTMSAGSVSFDDVTLAWTLSGLPDADRLESDLTEGAATEVIAAEDSSPEGNSSAPRESVRFAGVAFRYPGTAVDVLAGVDLELRTGTSTALVGVNGAGKSTLVSLLARLRDPTQGAVLVDGTDVRDLDPARWQRTVALMPQSPVRYPVSAYDNIAFGALEHHDDKAGVERAARKSGFSAVVADLPNGWDTLLARELPGGVELSGGQWQRLALARALFATEHGARVLVLDEPTAHLDAATATELIRDIMSAAGEKTVLLITHRPEGLDLVDRVISL